MANVYQSDSCIQVARKIYENFDVGESCVITGFIIQLGDSVTRGELILKEIERMDMDENIRFISGAKKQRKYVYKKGSIGGPISQKIFTFEKRIVDSEVRYTIWRFQ